MIEFRNVSKVYDSNGTHALSNVNIKIEDGEFVFVVVYSGEGKSTFLKLIMHEEKATDCLIIFNEYSSATLKKKQVPYYRREMGIVFQDFRLIPKMSVYDNVAFAMRVIGAKEKEIRKRVPYILQLVGLSQKARSMPNELSGGEQQRVSLARALVNNPKVIIADEPTGNVDPEMSHEIVGLVTTSTIWLVHFIDVLLLLKTARLYPILPTLPMLSSQAKTLKRTPICSFLTRTLRLIMLTFCLRTKTKRIFLITLKAL